MIIRICRALFCRVVWYVCILFPINKSKITVSNFCGKGYGDNPKYIVEQLLKKKKKLKIIWLSKSAEEKDSLPCGVEWCPYNSIKSIYHLSTSKIWIDNCRKGYFLKKSDQIYIQTWHGFALKRIESDVADTLNKRYVRSAIHDSKHINLVISDSKFMTQIFNNSFWYNGSVEEWGAPRNDILVHGSDKARQKVFDAFRVDSRKKIVLYAPTFRANKATDAYSLDFDRVLNACKQKFKNDFVAMVRLHPNMTSSDYNCFSGDKTILDASFYPDLQELLCAVDIVITDYSSIMFDFAFTNKPCFQFATDIEEYKKDRNFYFPIESLPFDMCTNNEEIELKILSFNSYEYLRKIQTFFNSCGMILDGCASEKAADWIIGKTKL